MTLRAKLLVAQVPLALSLVIIGVVSRQTVGALDRNAQNILKDNHLSVLAAQRMRDVVDSLARAALDHARDRAVPTAGALAQKAASFERELRFQEENITEVGERAMTTRLRSEWARFQSDWAHVMAAPPAEAERASFDALGTNRAVASKTPRPSSSNCGRLKERLKTRFSG